MKQIASHTILMQLTHKVGQAKLNKDSVALKKAKKELEAYKKIILKKDAITALNMTVGQLQ